MRPIGHSGSSIRRARGGCPGDTGRSPGQSRATKRGSRERGGIVGVRSEHRRRTVDNEAVGMGVGGAVEQLDLPASTASRSRLRSSDTVVSAGSFHITMICAQNGLQTGSPAVALKTDGWKPMGPDPRGHCQRHRSGRSRIRLDQRLRRGTADHTHHRRHRHGRGVGGDVAAAGIALMELEGDGAVSRSGSSTIGPPPAASQGRDRPAGRHRARRRAGS